MILGMDLSTNSDIITALDFIKVSESLLSFQVKSLADYQCIKLSSLDWHGTESEIHHLGMPVFLKPNHRILEHNGEGLDLEEYVPAYAYASNHMP